MLTCKVGNTIINCFDGKYDKHTLKKWDEEKRLICPDCGKLYEYCHGQVVTPYFRHKEKEECDRSYSEPETQEHIRGKLILYNWLKTLEQSGLISDVILEAYIPETRQHPDLFFIMNGQKCVIELQCSPLSTKFLERHELYKLAGIKDIWIMGLEKYNIQICDNKIIHSKRYKTIEEYCSLYLDVKNSKLIYNGKHLWKDNLSEKFINNRYIIDDINKFTIKDNNIVPYNKILKKIIANSNKDYRHYLRRKYKTKSSNYISKSFIRKETHVALDKLNQLDLENMDIFYFEKESNYYICSIKLNYFNRDYIFYIKEHSIDFCKYDGYSHNIDSFAGRKINNHSIYYYIKKNINYVIKQNELELEQKKIEQYRLENTYIKIIDGNFDVNIDYIPHYNLFSNIVWYIDEIKRLIKRIDKSIVYILYKTTIEGQSISNRNRNRIIKKLNNNGLNNVEFYKEEIKY